MPNNYVLLETIALTQSAASVTFDNLPTSGYTDLKIVMSTRSTTAGLYAGYQTPVFARFNGTTTGYSMRWIQAEGGSSVNSGAEYFGMTTTYAFFGTSDPSDWTANTFGNSEVYIPNYRSSVAKSFSVDAVAENNGSFGSLVMNAGLWNNTAAITSIVIQLERGSFAANSTFSLYGIAALGTTPTLAPKATGGNIVANDGTYWYHAFTSSGYFVPQTSLTADVLVIAGGGGGGCDQTAGTSAAGGGTGGILYSTGQSLSTQASITIGAGGAGKANSSAGNGTNGSNSVFTGALTYTGVGGGGGAGFAGAGSANGNSGGSGGGGVGPSGTGGTATQNSTNGTGYGNAGGVKGGGNNGGAGGGGAGAVGGSVNGGAGLNTWSAWATATTTGVSGYYAGGGGGRDGFSPFTNGTGGSGGGGNYGGANSGVASTGSGGGGGGGEGGAAGGSGIVIIRYPVN